MEHQAEFRFYAGLNDFIAPAKRQKPFIYSFTPNPSVKDSIEAIGAPHTEVELIIVNGQPVLFDYKLQNGDKVSVYPVFHSLEIQGPPLREPSAEIKFLVDANIGKMAKLLRMLGFDTYFDFDLPDKEIADLAEREKRIILTRDIGLLKRKNVTHGYFLRKTNIEEQVMETIERFNLLPVMKPFSMCLECNGSIVPVEKNSIQDKLKPEIFADYQEFFNCLDCRKIYWKGSHYDTMLQKIAKIYGENV
jgi:uncharacterized protein with PIN domain